MRKGKFSRPLDHWPSLALFRSTWQCWFLATTLPVVLRLLQQFLTSWTLHKFPDNLFISCWQDVVRPFVNYLAKLPLVHFLRRKHDPSSCSDFAFILACFLGLGHRSFLKVFRWDHLRDISLLLVVADWSLLMFRQDSETRAAFALFKLELSFTHFFLSIIHQLN